MKGFIKLIIGSMAGLFVLGITIFLMAIMAMVVLFGDIDFKFGKEEQTGSPSEIAKKEIPEKFIPIYKEAGKKYEIPWLLLASIHRVETVFSTTDMVSSIGAEGHLQFMPCSWVGWEYPFCEGLGGTDIPKKIKTDPDKIKEYGGFGVDANNNGKASPWEKKDAIFAAANHLEPYITKSSDLRRAIQAYNHADWYVDDVMHFYETYTAGYEAKGENDVEIEGDKAWIVPHTKNLSSKYGNRMMNGKQDFHPGIDIAGGNDRGKSIVAFSSGKVVYSQFNHGGFGNLVIIQHDNGMLTYYAHMMQKGIAVGTKVKAGQVIGKMGTTGDSTGVHLHFEVHVKKDNGEYKRVNPMPYVKEFLNNG